MNAGTVKWFDCKKGFGFIVTDDGQDVFVHFSVIEGEGFRSLKEKEVVSYELSTGPNGLLATKVVRDLVKRPAVSARPASKLAAPAA